MCARLASLVLAAIALIGAALSGAEPAWRPLLNGRDLSGWDTFLSTPEDPAQVFVIDRTDGEPVVHISGRGFGVMTTRETFSNFHLRLEVKWGEQRWGKKALAPRDSGLLYFVHGDAGAVDGNWPRSIEFQIQEHDMGDLYALGTQITVSARKAGELWLYDPLGEPTVFVQRMPIWNRAVRLVDAEKLKGEWNTLELICMNGWSIHVVNDRVVMRLGPAQRLDGPEPAPLTSGRISLQTEGAEVFYRRVEVLPITEVPAAFAVRSGM